jgi:hypothetical protein
MCGCSSERVREKLQPTGRALQPTVNAFECGGASVKAAIASCRTEGGSYGHCAIVASRSGVSDATACYNYAADIHKRREQLVGQEDQLDAQIRYLADVNVDTERLNAELNGRIEEMTARTDAGVDSLAQGEMTASELAQLRSILDVEVSSAQRQLDAASRELQAAERYRSRQQPSTAALDTEIAQLRALLNETQRQISALIAQRHRI